MLLSSTLVIVGGYRQHDTPVTDRVGRLKKQVPQFPAITKPLGFVGGEPKGTKDSPPLDVASGVLDAGGRVHSMEDTLSILAEFML